MEFVSRYISHIPDAEGKIAYSQEEHEIWRILYERQMKILPGRACDEFLAGLKALNLNAQAIPQLPEVSTQLRALTGWEVVAVPSLISAREFFQLLAQRKFPAATFIRDREELDYVKEPDIFHELFGHCPLLTDPVYAEFVFQFAQRVLSFPEEEWPLLQRLFWFTVEFGLIKTPVGIRAYGGGILSSIKETPYSVESYAALRVIFNPVTAFRMPYRIDRLQAVYFVIDDYKTLYDFVKSDIQQDMQKARELGEYPPLFPIEENNPNIHILAC